MAYKPGDYYVICDRCGFKRYRSECRMTYDNFLVCADTCWHPRHPQEYMVKPLADRQRVPLARPEFTADTAFTITHASATMTIDITEDRLVKDYEGTLTLSTGQSVDLTGSGYDTLGELVEYLNGLSGYTCTIGTYASTLTLSVLLEECTDESLVGGYSATLSTTDPYLSPGDVTVDDL